MAAPFATGIGWHAMLIQTTTSGRLHSETEAAGYIELSSHVENGRFVALAGVEWR